jgi:hypothetical protein
MQNKDVKPMSIRTSSLVESNANENEKRQSTKEPSWLISTQVLAGKKIEILSPELPVGEAVDVFIIPPDISTHSQRLMIDLLESVRLLDNQHSQGRPVPNPSSALKPQSNVAVAIKVLEAIEDYLSPEPGSLFEEMLNDALEGRIRGEATDIQDKMLVQHHAKSYIQQAIAALERLNSQLLS